MGFFIYFPNGSEWTKQDPKTKTIQQYMLARYFRWSAKDTVVRAQVLFVWYRFYAKKFPLSCRRHAGSRCEAFLAKSVSGLASGYKFLSCRFFSIVSEAEKLYWHPNEKQTKFSLMHRWYSDSRMYETRWIMIMKMDSNEWEKNGERGSKCDFPARSDSHKF